MYYELTDHFRVRASMDQAWAFFGDAENLARITPPWMRFSVNTPRPFTIGPESQLDYTIRWMGIPVRWRTRIIQWTPPTQFIDLQVRGPYALWLHQHTFVPAEDGVECRDRVIYRLPVPLLGRAVHAAVVRRQLLGIFRFRREAIGRLLGEVRPLQPDVRIQRL